MTDKIDLSNPNGTVFGLMPEEWQVDMLEYYRNGWKVEWFGGTAWLSKCAGNALLTSKAYRAAPESLIPDSIDWSHVADEFICMARDESGSTYVYTTTPQLCLGGWFRNPGSYPLYGLKSLKIGNMPWDQSLVWRPGYGPEGKQ